MQSFKKTGIKLHQELQSQGTHCLYIYMEKTSAKFQKDWYKIVRGVALTRGIKCLYIEGEK